MSCRGLSSCGVQQRCSRPHVNLACHAKPLKQSQPIRKAPQRTPKKPTSPIKIKPKLPWRLKGRQKGSQPPDALPKLPWRLKSRKKDNQPPDAEPRWQILNLKAYSQVDPWQVPWGWPTIVIGTGAWAVSFVLTGILAIPIAVYGFGVTDLQSLTPLQQSQIQLLDQVRPALPLGNCISTVLPCEPPKLVSDRMLIMAAWRRQLRLF